MPFGYSATHSSFLNQSSGLLHLGMPLSCVSMCIVLSSGVPMSSCIVCAIVYLRRGVFVPLRLSAAATTCDAAVRGRLNMHRGTLCLYSNCACQMLECSRSDDMRLWHNCVKVCMWVICVPTQKEIKKGKDCGVGHDPPNIPLGLHMDSMPGMFASASDFAHLD